MSRYDQPNRPVWLDPSDALDLKKVYEKLCGLVTYGSPLQTFAKTWPAIIPIRKETDLPAGFEWINVYDITDMIGSKLTSFVFSANSKKVKPQNICVASSILVTSSHTGYLRHIGSDSGGSLVADLMEWVISGTVPTANSPFYGIDTSRLGGRIKAGFRWLLVIIQLLIALVVGCLIWPFAARKILLAFDTLGSTAVHVLNKLILYLIRPFHGELSATISSCINAFDRTWDEWLTWIATCIGKVVSNEDIGHDVWKWITIVGFFAASLFILGVIRFFADKWILRRMRNGVVSRSPNIKVDLGQASS